MTTTVGNRVSQKLNKCLLQITKKESIKYIEIDGDRVSGIALNIECSRKGNAEIATVWWRCVAQKREREKKDKDKSEVERKKNREVWLKWSFQNLWSQGIGFLLCPIPTQLFSIFIFCFLSFNEIAFGLKHKTEIFAFKMIQVACVVVVVVGLLAMNERTIVDHGNQ